MLIRAFAMNLLGKQKLSLAHRPKYWPHLHLSLLLTTYIQAVTIAYKQPITRRKNNDSN